MEELLDIIKVEPHEDMTLDLLFENNKKRIFNMAPLLEEKPFCILKQPGLFMKAKIAYGTVIWPGNIDIAPETLWDLSEQA